MQDEQPLTVQHPINRLEMYDLEPGKWDWQNPPELYLVNNDSEIFWPVPYMPPLGLIEVEEKATEIKPLTNGQFRFSFRLNHAVNPLWLSFLKRHANNVDVTAEEDMLMLSCDPKDLATLYEEICLLAVGKARKDYCEERDKLVWLVFDKMKAQERCEHIKAEILAELSNCQRKKQERSLVAQQNGWSVSFVVRNFTENYKEILERKFVWWAKVLDDTTIRQYRAMFEMELLVV